MLGYCTHVSGKVIVMAETLSTNQEADDVERLDSICKLDDILNGNHSGKNLVPQCIHTISTCFCIAVSKAIPSLPEKAFNSRPHIVTITLTPSGLDIHHDIKQFLIFAYIHANLTVSEMIHVLFLIELYLNKDGEAVLSQTDSTISEATLGSLLVCSLMIS
jgi:hypothetical protein